MKRRNCFYLSYMHALLDESDPWDLTSLQGTYSMNHTMQYILSSRWSSCILISHGVVFFGRIILQTWWRLEVHKMQGVFWKNRILTSLQHKGVELLFVCTSSGKRIWSQAIYNCATKANIGYNIIILWNTPQKVVPYPKSKFLPLLTTENLKIHFE